MVASGIGRPDLPGRSWAMTMRNLNERPTRQDRRELARDSADLLRTLGDDAATVAESLASAGVKGAPTDARQCALAVYFGAVMAGDPRVSGVRVFHDRLVIGSPGRLFTRRVGVPLPSSVRTFIAGFDARHYPSLMRPDERPKEGASPSSSGHTGRMRSSLVS